MMEHDLRALAACASQQRGWTLGAQQRVSTFCVRWFSREGELHEAMAVVNQSSRLCHAALWSLQGVRSQVVVVVMRACTLALKLRVPAATQVLCAALYRSVPVHRKMISLAE